MNVTEKYPKEVPCDNGYYCEDPEHLGTVEWSSKPHCTLPEDDGTMSENVETLSDLVVGHRIVKAERRKDVPGRNAYRGERDAFVLTLDNGIEVAMRDTSDCCAHTELESFLLHADKIDHIITGVGTTDGFEKWHIYADFGDVMELQVGWSAGNPFYYGYGFEIEVVPVTQKAACIIPVTLDAWNSIDRWRLGYETKQTAIKEMETQLGEVLKPTVEEKVLMPHEYDRSLFNLPEVDTPLVLMHYTAEVVVDGRA